MADTPIPFAATPALPPNQEHRTQPVVQTYPIHATDQVSTKLKSEKNA